MTNINVEELVKARLAKMPKVSKQFKETLTVNAYINRRLDEIDNKVEAILNKKPWNNFYFRTGRIMGLLQTMMMNPKEMDKLVQATGISEDYVEAYRNYGGCLPYVSKQTGAIESRQMDPDMCKDLIIEVATVLGIPIDENMLDDINQDRWEMLFKASMERCQNTLDLAVNQELINQIDPDSDY